MSAAPRPRLLATCRSRLTENCCVDRFHLKGHTLSYFETNKIGVGKKECGKIDLSSVVEARESSAPVRHHPPRTRISLVAQSDGNVPGAQGATEFEIELCTDERTYRFRAFNHPEMRHWLAVLQHFVA